MYVGEILNAFFSKEKDLKDTKGDEKCRLRTKYDVTFYKVNQFESHRRGFRASMILALKN